MKIRFTNPTTVRMTFQAGDEITVRRVTPELQAVLDSTRLDGQTVAQIVAGADDEEITDVPRGDVEHAVTGKGRRGGGQRSTPVSE